MARTMMDINLGANDDLYFTGGDFTNTESTTQHQRQLLLNAKGDFKQHPTIGVGAFTYFDDEQYQQLIRAISIEFSRDGMQVTSINLGTDGVLRSEAEYV